MKIRALVLLLTLVISIAPIYANPLGAAHTASQSIIRRSEGVLRGNAIQRVTPLYPEEAKNAKVDGDVVIEILIDEDGNVQAAKAIKGPTLLREPSVEAAKQWKFKQTILNGEPVKVSGVITFRFALE